MSSDTVSATETVVPASVDPIIVNSGSVDSETIVSTSELTAPAPEPPKVTEGLRENLREYIDLTEQIKNVRRDVKVLVERQKELSVMICDFMVENDIPAFKTPNGKVSVCETKSTQPLNKDYIYETISKSGKVDTRLAKELTDIVFLSRQVTPGQKIKVNLTKRTNAGNQ